MAILPPWVSTEVTSVKLRITAPRAAAEAKNRMAKRYASIVPSGTSTARRVWGLIRPSNSRARRGGISVAGISAARQASTKSSVRASPASSNARNRPWLYSKQSPAIRRRYPGFGHTLLGYTRISQGVAGPRMELTVMASRGSGCQFSPFKQGHRKAPEG